MSAVVIKEEPKEEEVGGGEVISKSIFSVEYNRAQLPHLLRVYYTWLFPYDKYFDWLQYGKWRARPLVLCKGRLDVGKS